MSRDNRGKEEQVGEVNSVVRGTIDREIRQEFVSDGVYKYVYVDTGEDIKSDSE